jgi:hypothetical protein
LTGLVRSRAALQAEILVLRHQVNVLRRKSPKRLAFTGTDRLVFVALYRLAPGILDALKILKPETVIRWHRAGLRAYWSWKSRPRGGRVRQIIRQMSVANPIWGAPRIHGELLKLGIDVGQTTVAKYMVKRRRPPSQGWKTFLRNHAGGIASMDLFVVPTISFRLLYGFLILRHCRRELLWLGVTAHPSAECARSAQSRNQMSNDRETSSGSDFVCSPRNRDTPSTLAWPESTRTSRRSPVPLRMWSALVRRKSIFQTPFRSVWKPRIVPAVPPFSVRP